MGKLRPEEHDYCQCSLESSSPQPAAADLWCHVSGSSGPLGLQPRPAQLPSRRLHQLLLLGVGELWRYYGVFAATDTVTSAQDPVQEVVSELQCKIADLGNACWEVGEDILLTKRRPSLNIVYRFIDIMFLHICVVAPAVSVSIIWSFN